MTTDARQLIKRHEGCRLKPYADSEGVQTIGYGHRLANGISLEVAAMIFGEDFAAAVSAAASIFDITPDPTQPRHAALIDMAFELGEGGLRAFVQLRACVERDDWDGAAAAALDSRYARQVPNRADDIAALLRTGSWDSLD